MRTERDTPDDEVSAGAAVQTALSRVLRWASRPAVRARLSGPAGRGLSATDGWLLGQVVTAGPVRLSTLAAFQDVDKSTITPQVRRLEERGLVLRRPDPDDARAALLSPTTAGRRLHRRVVASGAAVFDEVMQSWPEADRRALGTLLLRLTTDLERAAD